MFYMVLKGKI